MNKIKFSIARDYTRTPGPRYIWQGKYSGEDFLQSKLLELFDRVVKEGLILEVDLDHTAGFGPSFLEESFGGLARIRNKQLVIKHIIFISEEEPYLIEEIQDYIKNAIPEA